MSQPTSREIEVPRITEVTRLLPSAELERAGSEGERDEAHARELSLLEQRASALENEVARRRQLEAALRAALAERTLAESQLAEALVSETAAREEAERSREELREQCRINETLHRI